MDIRDFTHLEKTSDALQYKKNKKVNYKLSCIHLKTCKM